LALDLGTTSTLGGDSGLPGPPVANEDAQPTSPAIAVLVKRSQDRGRADVTAMLVNRYFGSNEQLFAKAIAESMATTSVLATEIVKPDASGEAIAAALIGITKDDHPPLEGSQITLRLGHRAIVRPKALVNRASAAIKKISTGL